MIAEGMRMLEGMVVCFGEHGERPQLKRDMQNREQGCKGWTCWLGPADGGCSFTWSLAQAVLLGLWN